MVKRRRSYAASKRPDFYGSMDDLADRLKIDKKDPSAMVALQRLAFIMQRKRSASYK